MEKGADQASSSPMYTLWKTHHDNDDDDLGSISTTNAPVAVFRTCIKHQRKTMGLGGADENHGASVFMQRISE
jgi:hypothetical protein